MTLLALSQLAIGQGRMYFNATLPEGHVLRCSLPTDGSGNLIGNFATAHKVVSHTIGNLTIPDSVEYNGSKYVVKSIDANFQPGAWLTSVSIPATVTSIGFSAFSGCSNLASIFIPNSVVSIGNTAFQNCSSLVSIQLPMALASVESGTFKGCSSLQSVALPSTITAIGSDAFYECSSLRSITIPKNVSVIGRNAFYNCSGLDTINYYATNCTSSGETMGSAYFPAFGSGFSSSSTKVKVLNIGRNVKHIPEKAFYGCDSLKAIVIPDSVLTIGNEAFMRCRNVSSITMKGNPPQIYNRTFYTIPSYIPVYTPCGTLSSYQSASDWSSFTNFIDACVVINVSANDPVKGGVTGGGNYMLGDTVTLTAIPFPGASFVGWSNGARENPLTFVASQTQTIIAAFGNAPLARDTVYLRDTVYINNYLHDTIVQYVENLVHDTMFYVVHIHDTVYVGYPVHDTTYLPVYIHDTTIVNDTLVVNEYISIHDTVYFPFYIHDTVRMHDTTIVRDTIVVNEYIPIRDTMYFPYYIHDTIRMHDTTIVRDTIVVNEYIPIHDTMYFPYYIHDTIMIHDTTIVYDTVYVNDTVHVGIDEVEMYEAKVFVEHGQIVVIGSEGRRVALYDAIGRCLASNRKEGESRFDVPVSGAYFIKIGDAPARRITVIR